MLQLSILIFRFISYLWPFIRNQRTDQNMNKTFLTFPFPWWYILACIAIGVLFAYVLYRRTGTDNAWTSQRKIAMFILRALSVAIICFLLLSPIIRHLNYDTQKPLIYIGIDQSQSVGHTLKDPSKLLARIDELQKTLSKEYSVETFSIGEEATPGLKEKFTSPASNLNDFFKSINENATFGQNGAVILLSDGIFNGGPSPLFEASRSKLPIYSIAVGDSLPARDLTIPNIGNNEIGFSGDKSNIQVDLQGFNLSGNSGELVLSKIENGKTKTLAHKSFSIDNKDFFETIPMEIELNSVGLQHYQVSVSHLPGEATYENNQKSFYIEVIDSKLNIDLIAASPNPDVAAIKEALLQDKNYDLKVHFLSEPIKLHPRQDLVILYQVPTINAFANTFEQLWPGIQNKKVPRLFILGSQSNIPRFNSIQDALTLNGSQLNSNDVYPEYNPRFNAFNVPPEWKMTWEKYPPLQVPFGQFSASPGMLTLLTQQIGRVNTPYPLWILGTDQSVKTGVIAGEGLWRWRMNEAKEGIKDTHFDELIKSTVRYLVARDDKRKFRIKSDEHHYSQNQQITLTAELYNDSYEPINTPQVEVTVSDQKGKKYKFLPGRNDQYYSVNIGTMPPGEYSYSGVVDFNGEKLTAVGSFEVSPLQQELFDLVADYGLMDQLAIQNNGAMISVNEIEKLPSMIATNDIIKPIINKQYKSDPLINLKWIFLLLLGLLSAEWFLRRYSGRY